MSAYIDSGVLVKNYCPEENSSTAVALIFIEEPPLILCPLQESEVRNAIRLKVFRHEISAVDGQAALANLAKDIREGLFIRPDYSTSSVFRRAEGLSANYTANTGARLLDILHVATALELGLANFVSLDHRQRTIARKAGLKVLPNT